MIATYYKRVVACSLLMFCLAESRAERVVVAEARGIPELVSIPAGEFIQGSDDVERELAYRLDERAYQHSVTRQQGWYDAEVVRRTTHTAAFRITRYAITNDEYAQFVRATGHRAPDVDIKTWTGYGLIHPYSRTRRHAWRNGAPPPGRGRHPVVLVSYSDAVAYANWLSQRTGKVWRLPSEVEWEKAVRGTDGRYFPWGMSFEPTWLNSHDQGPFDTQPVGTYPEGVGPFGVMDGAGGVFEWTASAPGRNRYLVKGGSWDDKGCGVCRPAARHARAHHLKHILIGFRLVVEP